MSQLKAHFRNWLSSLDQDKLVLLADSRSWGLVLTFSLAAILAGSVLPVTSGFFQMEFFTPLIAWLVLCAGASLEFSRRLKEWLSFPAYGLMRMGVGLLLQFFSWTLVVSSSLMGGAVLAAFAILIASYHGQFYQISARYPYGAFITILALAGAFLLDQDLSHMPILVLGGLMALGAGWIMGGNERQRLTHVTERDALRAALDAQLIYERATEVEHVQSAIKEIRGTNHDASNVLSGILMNLQFLTTRLSDMEKELQPAGDLLEISEDLGGAVTRLRHLIEKGRDAGGEISSYESVYLMDTLNRVIKEHQKLFSNVRIEIIESPSVDVKLSLPGGEETLSRILTNIIRNACEGDGSATTSVVELSVVKNGENDWVDITVKDNGPGFTKEQLMTSVSHLQTTKAIGTGLGLYTTHRLLTACKGELILRNGKERGAEVSIVIPLQS